MDSRNNPVVWKGWQWAGLVALALAFAGYVMAASFAAFARGSVLHDPALAFGTACGLLLMGFGALVLTRGRRSRAAALLGAMLMALAIQASPGPFAGQLPSRTSAVFLLTIIINTALSSCLGSFWPLFTLEISGGPASRRQLHMIRTLAAFCGILPLGASIALNLNRPTLAAGIWTVVILGTQLLGYWILAANYRRNDAAGRNRIKIVVCAFMLFMLAGFGSVYGILVGERFGAVVAGLSLAGAVPLVYAVLRHRLFDFGFALNRTLVYGAVSFILLAAFGLAEWAIEHLVPPSWHANGPLFSAAIALALFLSFHRLRDWVERHVEKVFFGSWHRNEETLRRFIAAADHFGSTAALYKAFASELSRFAGGADAALYLRDGTGGYELKAGRLAKAGRRLPDDDRVLALMRAERRAIDIHRAHSTLPGVLALPMIDQGALPGFVLLGRKADGTDYRPDEVELLCWAAQQVGFAAQAQHVRQLEATVAELRTQVAALADGRGRATAPAGTIAVLSAAARPRSRRSQ